MKRDRDQRPRSNVTRRDFLHSVGAAGGSSMVYRAMGALGLLAGCAPRESELDKVDDLSSPLADNRDVIVLGAGIAGLTAAYELTRLGFRVKVLEATRRAGGRNFTARAGDVLTEIDSEQVCGFERADHHYVNLGPARIPYHHDRLLGYCKKLGVELEVFTNDNRAAHFHSERAKRSVVARHLYTDVRGHIAELLAKAVQGGTLDAELTDVDREAFLEMLTTFGNLDAQRAYTGSERAGFRDRTNAGLEHPHALPVAPVTPLRDILGDSVFHDYRLDFSHGLNQQPTMFQPVGGMDRIVRAFASRVGHLIQYGCPVLRIENTNVEGGAAVAAGQGVEVTYRDEQNAIRKETARFVICTIPATVLRDVESNFRAELKAEIAAMTYVQAVKVGFQARRRFWEEDLQIYGGISWTDEEATQVWYPATGYHRATGVLLAAYTWDPPQNAFFAERSPQERLRVAARQLDNLHPGAARHLGAGVSRAWGKVPFQKGGWATEDPDFQKHDELARGDGRVYFAGEHVSYLHGWQEGAILSARAAVRTIALRAVGAA